MTGEGGRRARQPSNDRIHARAVLRQARHSASIFGLGANRRRGRAGARGERARTRLSLFRSAGIRARRGGAGDDRVARRPFDLGAPGAGGGFVQVPRCAARRGLGIGGGRAGSRHAGASALGRADRCGSRRVRGERRRRGPDGGGAPAKPAASRKSRAGRDRTIRRRSRAHRQHRDRLSGGIAPAHFCPLRRRHEPARGAARAPRAARSFKGAHRGGGGKGSGRRGVAMDVAPAGRARRPRGARPGNLHDRFVMPSGRADGAYACAARGWRTDAGLALAFAARRRTDASSRTLWRNCLACRCRASPPSCSSRREKALPRSPAGLA